MDMAEHIYSSLVATLEDGDHEAQQPQPSPGGQSVSVTTEMFNREVSSDDGTSDQSISSDTDSESAYIQPPRHEIRGENHESNAETDGSDSAWIQLSSQGQQNAKKDIMHEYFTVIGEPLDQEIQISNVEENMSEFEYLATTCPLKTEPSIGPDRLEYAYSTNVCLNGGENRAFVRSENKDYAYATTNNQFVNHPEPLKTVQLFESEKGNTKNISKDSIKSSHANQRTLPDTECDVNAPVLIEGRPQNHVSNEYFTVNGKLSNGETHRASIEIEGDKYSYASKTDFCSTQHRKDHSLVHAEFISNFETEKEENALMPKHGPSPCLESQSTMTETVETEKHANEDFSMAYPCKEQAIQSETDNECCTFIADDGVFQKEQRMSVGTGVDEYAYCTDLDIDRENDTTNSDEEDGHYNNINDFHSQWNGDETISGDYDFIPCDTQERNPITPLVVISPTAYSVTAGQSVTIQCSVSSNLNISFVSWVKNHSGVLTTITPTTNRYKYRGSTVTTPSLTIDNIVSTDAGNYRCIAANIAASGSSNPGVLSVTENQIGFHFVFGCPEPFDPRERNLVFFIYSSQTGSIKIQKKKTLNKKLETGTNKLVLYREFVADKSYAIRIVSNVPVYIFGVVLYDAVYHDDGFYVIPKQHLSKQYIIPSMTVHHVFDASWIGIASSDSPCEVNITVRTTRNMDRLNGGMYDNGEIITFFLGAYKSRQIIDDYDLSGTTITASSPISVISGNKCLRIDSSHGDCNPSFENVLPIDQHDTDFIVPSIQSRPESIVRVYSYNRNYVTIHSIDREFYVQIEPKDYYEFLHKKISYINAISGLLVMVYPKEVKGGESFMMTIHGKNQYKSEYFFVVPEDTSDQGYYISFSCFRNCSDGFKLDGKLIIIRLVKTIVFEDKTLASFSLRVTNGAHKVTHNKGHRFGLWVYLNSYWRGYGFPAGIQFL